jgi:hypothetical protein
MRETGRLPGGIKCAVVDPGQADRLNAKGLAALSTEMTAMTGKDL